MSKEAMTLKELSIEYRAQATVLRGRIQELRGLLPEQEEDQRSTTEARIRMLAIMWRETYGWVCGFGGKVTVTAPAEVRARLANLGRKLREVY